MKNNTILRGGEYLAPQIDVTLFVTERGFIDSVEGVEGLTPNYGLGWDEE